MKYPTSRLWHFRACKHVYMAGPRHRAGIITEGLERISLSKCSVLQTMEKDLSPDFKSWRREHKGTTPVWEAGEHGPGSPELQLLPSQPQNLGIHNMALIPLASPTNVLIWYSLPFTSSFLFFIQSPVVSSTASYFHIFLKWVTSWPNFLMSVEPQISDIPDDTFR